MLVDGTEKQTETADDFTIPAAITDTGCERQLNEDRYAVIESVSGVAWVVCDGMGGVTGGELAAQLAIDAMRRDLENLPPRPSAAALKASILEANRVIVLRRQNPAFSAMGTTVVAAMFNGPEVSICSAGDSRAYLIRDSAIQQLTVDHTYVQDLVDGGKISADEALSHPQAHVLTRCIGSEPALEVDLERYWLWDLPTGEKADFLLLCTDGLYSLVTEAEIASIVTESPPQRACVRLVELAKSRGGYDNISLAIIPLGAQLRNKPPVGYEEKAKPVKAKKSQIPASGLSSKLTKIIVICLLCGLAGLVTILIMAFYISKQ